MSTCRLKGPKDVWIERTYDYVVASGSLKGKISQMKVVEDFESRPHKAALQLSAKQAGRADGRETDDAKAKNGNHERSDKENQIKRKNER